MEKLSSFNVIALSEQIMPLMRSSGLIKFFQPNVGDNSKEGGQASLFFSSRVTLSNATNLSAVLCKIVV